MQKSIKRLFNNLALLTGTLLACFLVLEFVIFKYLLIPDDVLHNVTVNSVVRYQPNTRAVFRHPDRSRSEVTINRDGWNSTHPAYYFQKPPGVLRVAVVGDSYVHGAFIDVDQGFPKQLQSVMNENGVRAEVYRFGMDGAPLSQYLHMLRNTVVDYRPDLVIIPLIHNDFDEIYRMIGSRYNSSFLKITRDVAGHAQEIAPRDFRPGLADLLRNFRTFRYLYYETGAYLNLKKYVNRLFWGGNAEHRAEFISSAIDIRNIKNEDENIRFYTRYVLSQFKALSEQHQFKLLFVMDGVREAVYEGRAVADYEVGKLNVVAAELCRELNLPFIDLQNNFRDHFAKRAQRFEFPFDWHWNELGNKIVAGAIWARLKADRVALLSPTRRIKINANVLEALALRGNNTEIAGLRK